MRNRFANILLEHRGCESRAKFASRLGLSYTFVREMELGNRLPSDEILTRIAVTLEAPIGPLFQAVYCDRSPGLAAHIEGGGVQALESELAATSSLGTSELAGSVPLASTTIQAVAPVANEFSETAAVRPVSA